MKFPPILPAEVTRDEDGMWTHPAFPHSDEEGIPLSWFIDRGLQVTTVSLESDGPEEITTAYFESGEPDCSDWEPSSPQGDGWFIFSIHDTEDGPICAWVRPAPSPKPACPDCGAVPFPGKIFCEQHSYIMPGPQLGAAYSAYEICSNIDQVPVSYAANTTSATQPDTIPIPRALLQGLVGAWNREGVTNQGAPDHGHSVPGVWDSDWADRRAGKPCAECALYEQARALLNGGGR